MSVGPFWFADVKSTFSEDCSLSFGSIVWIAQVEGTFIVLCGTNGPFVAESSVWRNPLNHFWLQNISLQSKCCQISCFVTIVAFLLFYICVYIYISHFSFSLKHSFENKWLQMSCFQCSNCSSCSKYDTCPAHLLRLIKFESGEMISLMSPIHRKASH